MAFFLSKTHQTDSIISYSLQMKFKRFFLLKSLARFKMKKTQSISQIIFYPTTASFNIALAAVKVTIWRLASSHKLSRNVLKVANKTKGFTL